MKLWGADLSKQSFDMGFEQREIVGSSPARVCHFAIRANFFSPLPAAQEALQSTNCFREVLHTAEPLFFAQRPSPGAGATPQVVSVNGVALTVSQRVSSERCLAHPSAHLQLDHAHLSNSVLAVVSPNRSIHGFLGCWAV